MWQEIKTIKKNKIVAKKIVKKRKKYQKHTKPLSKSFEIANTNQ